MICAEMFGSSQRVKEMTGTMIIAFSAPDPGMLPKDRGGMPTRGLSKHRLEPNIYLPGRGLTVAQRSVSAVWLMLISDWRFMIVAQP